MARFKHHHEYLDHAGVSHYLLHYPVPEAAQAPVLLVVHGGPGFPTSNVANLLRGWWGELFSIVSWDQRGCGKTLAKNTQPPDYPVTCEALLGDMHAIIQHLKEAYRVPKVYVLGISWGTVLGSLYALRHPEDLCAYISSGQFCNVVRNEKLAYAQTLKAAAAAGAEKDITALKALAPYPEPPFGLDSECFTKKMPALKRLQAKYGLMMKVNAQLIIRFFFLSPAFRWSDFSSLSKQVAVINRELMECVFSFDLEDCGTDYQVPICYIVGDRDYQTSFPLAVSYFERINAPAKLLRVIEDASHNMIFDQPTAFAAAMADARALGEARA